MSTSFDADFEKIAAGFYPGTNKPIGTFRADPGRVKSRATEGLKPRIYNVGGKDVEFFTVGELAKALNREPGTIRKWENTGIIPKTFYSSPSEDPRGKRRLYTRLMIEGIVKIAIEEKVFYPEETRNIKGTDFTSKIVSLFNSLAKELG
jgi:hypothetical protein